MSKQICRILFMFAVVVGGLACQSALATITQMPTETATLPPYKSSIPTITNPMRTPTVAPEAEPVPTLAIQEQMGPLYEVVMMIPLGKDGLSYHGVGSPNMEVTGPNALAVLPNENFVVADLVGNRLLQYDVSGRLLKAIDLYSLDIKNISDLRTTEAGLYVLEVFLGPAPETYKVHHLSFEGDLIASHDTQVAFI